MASSSKLTVFPAKGPRLSGMRADASAAADPAWMTVSGMSFGASTPPHTNTPGLEVATGLSKGVIKKPKRLVRSSRRLASSRKSSRGLKPLDSTTRSYSSSIFRFWS